MSVITVTTTITRKWLERKSKFELASIILANVHLGKIDMFAEDQSAAILRELVRQMRERASFADTSASLSRLLQTWADVLDGKASTGWAEMNRADLQEAKEIKDGNLPMR